jgi:hypothetical protein
MRFILRFTGIEGQFHTELNLTAAAALARRSELLLPNDNRPSLYITDYYGRDIRDGELEQLASKESEQA